MKPIKNIFICLVHENQDCIIDLVRNLKYLDPQSRILLYNGGTDPNLFQHFPFERYDVIMHPSPRPLKWGWLHDFALDCMEFAIANLEFDLITVVDSDQLACGKNYSEYVSGTIRENSKLGMFGQIATHIDHNTKIDPAITAYQEKELWQPFLDQLPNGKNAFLYWTFWPSTAFTYNAAVDLLNLFRTNEQLKEILKKTKIWASEEILFPMLTVALGYTIVENPCSYDFVKYREKYSDMDIKTAMQRKDCFWIHPVDRKINNPARAAIRNYFEDYSTVKKTTSLSRLEAVVYKIAQKTNSIEGWLHYDEMELLARLSYKKASRKENPIFVEIGPYCGKATTVMTLAAKEVNDKIKTIAIDDFSGRLGAEDKQIDQYPPCFEKFQKTLDSFDISDQVEVIKKTPHLAEIRYGIDILLIDGLHDYASVARDFYTHEKKLYQDAIILFHDYSLYFPGVITFVDELVMSGLYKVLNKRASLIALKRVGNRKDKVHIAKTIANEAQLETKLPLVSCIMPTYNRPQFIASAINQFLQQAYPNKELIIIDDSEFSIERLVPKIDSIDYSYHKVKSDLGTKRNRACERAKGQIIIHLDDDDFYAPDWLEKQVSFLIEQELDVTGLSTPIFYDKRTADVWQYTYPEKEKPWVYGATLCYTKKLWQSNPFPVADTGEDNMFVWSNKVKKIHPHQEIESYIGQIHTTNTSPKQITDIRWAKLKEEQAKNILTYHCLS